MKKVVILFLVVLSIICLSVRILSTPNKQENLSFLELERESWENQKHIYCAEKFGFAYGRGSHNYRSLIFPKEWLFEWVAISDWQGFLIIKIDKLHKKMLKKLLKPCVEFEVSTDANGTTIKLLNNDWVAWECDPKKALQEKTDFLFRALGLHFMLISHDKIR